MLPASVRILVCTEAQDMRRSFDKLAEVVRTVMGEEPQSGALFVLETIFRKRGISIAGAAIAVALNRDPC